MWLAAYVLIACIFAGAIKALAKGEPEEIESERVWLAALCWPVTFGVMVGVLVIHFLRPKKNGGGAGPKGSCPPEAVDKRARAPEAVELDHPPRG